MRTRVQSLASAPAEALRRVRLTLRAPRQYRDTLNRLIQGDFSGLTPEQRRDKAEQVVQMGATAAMVLAALPVPFLDLPVQAAMVRAVAKVHGVRSSEPQLLWKLAVALGLGFTIREGLRFVPWAGSLTRLSRAYGAAWALGQTADLYFEHVANAQPPPAPGEARRLFADALQRKSGEQAARLEAHEAIERLRGLKSDWDAGRIDEDAFRRRIEALLAGP